MLFCALGSSDSYHPTAGSQDDATLTTDDARHQKKSAPSKSAQLARGTVIGHYTILEHLGSGGMASVYSAYDTHLERIVALKMLRAELEIEEVRARMLREAQAMARLKHEHVVTVYEVGTFDNRIYIAMEFVDGSTLSSWSKEPRPWRELLKVLKVKARLAPHKYPRWIEFIDALPKTATGKVQRYKLRAIARKT
jgi:serine/threonine protein kinase